MAHASAREYYAACRTGSMPAWEALSAQAQAWYDGEWIKQKIQATAHRTPRHR